MSLFRRRLMIVAALEQQGGGGESGDTLPSGYTKLEWIENAPKKPNKKQYIDLGLKAGKFMNYKIEAMPLKKEFECLIGGRTSYGAQNYSLWFFETGDETKFIYAGEVRTRTNKNKILNKKIVFEKTDGTHKIYDKNQIFAQTEWEIKDQEQYESLANMLLFDCGQPQRESTTGMGYTFQGRIYSAIIKDRNKTLRNLIPCKSPSGEVGMYDLVEGKFYGSATDVPFIAGGYIKFEDPEVAKICVQNFSSDGIGVSYADAEKVELIRAEFRNNKQVQTFNELEFFGIKGIGSTNASYQWGFCDCENLREIKLPNTLENLYNGSKGVYTGAFIGCASLTKVELGENIKLIGNGSFYECSKLQTLILRTKTPPSLGVYYPFDKTHPNFTIYVPDESVEAYKTAENWSAYADKIKPLSSYVEPTK